MSNPTSIVLSPSVKPWITAQTQAGRRISDLVNQGLSLLAAGTCPTCGAWQNARGWLGPQADQEWDRRRNTAVYVIVEREPGKLVAIKGLAAQADDRCLFVDSIAGGPTGTRRILRFQVRAVIKATQNRSDHGDLIREMPELSTCVEVG